MKRPDLEADPSLPRYRRHFVVRGQSIFGVALQETIGGVVSMLMPPAFVGAELEVQRMAYDCSMILINAVLHSVPTEPDHADSDYALPELHRETAPCVRTAIGHSK